MNSKVFNRILLIIIMDFGTRIKKAREKHGLTQQKMAEMLGMSDKMLGRYESGEFTGQGTRINKYISILEKIESTERGNLSLSYQKSSSSDFEEARRAYEILIAKQDDQIEFLREMLRGKLAAQGSILKPKSDKLKNPDAKN